MERKALLMPTSRENYHPHNHEFAGVKRPNRPVHTHSRQRPPSARSAPCPTQSLFGCWCWYWCCSAGGCHFRVFRREELTSNLATSQPARGDTPLTCSKALLGSRVGAATGCRSPRRLGMACLLRVVPAIECELGSVRRSSGCS